jgi:hypothetical protein
MSNSTTGVYAAGGTPSASNVMDFITIASTGNAASFGNITVAKRYLGGFSNGHGGLS